MVATLKQIVKVEPGGIIRIQSSQLQEGILAEVLVTAEMPSAIVDGLSTWDQFIGAGTQSGRSIAEIDQSIRELRDEWPQ